jgi:hypothetical protein
MKVIESNCQTGEVVERDMTPEEIAALPVIVADEVEESEEKPSE